jgi:hypothetical protein
LVRRNEPVALDEMLRREEYAFESTVEAVVAEQRQKTLDESAVREAWTRLAPATDRRLASLVPLVLHRPDLLEATLQAHARWASRAKRQDGYLVWQRPWSFPFWAVGMTLGALALRFDRYVAAKHLLSTTWTIGRHETMSFFVDHPGDLAQRVANAFGPEPPSGQWKFAPWQWLTTDIPAKQWLVDRYPHWLRRDGEPQASLAEFDLLGCIGRGMRSPDGQLGLFTFREDDARDYARRLHADAQLRLKAADAVGTTLEDFDERAPEILEHVHDFGILAATDVANTLRTGTLQ